MTTTMAQWEGIEDPSPTPAPVWLERPKEGDDDWKPLRKCDCHALNEHITSAQLHSSSPGDTSSSSEPVVYVEGGRAGAYPAEGRLVYTFVEAPEREIDYATWFVIQDETKKTREESLKPIFDKEETEKIEALYQKAVQASSSLGKGTSTILNEVVELSDESIVKVVKLPNSKLCMRRVPSGWFNQVNRSYQKLQRGYGEYTVPGEDNESLLGPVKHLVFVIHGVGETMWSRDDVKLPSMVAVTNQTRMILQEKQVVQWKKDCVQSEEDKDPPGRVEIIPIHWFDQLHNEDSSWKKSLQLTTLPTIPALRTLANDVILDVLLYMTPSFCQAVLECVTEQIQKVYSTFLQVHPFFEGTCALIGHSLGSVIAWDLLSILKEVEERNLRGVSLDQQQVGGASYAARQFNSQSTTGTWGPSLTKFLEQTIPFVPDTTIFLGSPLGIFLTLRGAHAAFEDLRTNASGNKQDTTGTAGAGASTTGTTEEEETTPVTMALVVADSPSSPMLPVVSPFTLPTKSLYNVSIVLCHHKAMLA
jgi:hypothetical protein